MVFNSFDFIAFLLIVIVFLLIERLITRNVTIRNITLLGASYFFYGYFNPGFLIILIFVTIVNYFGGVLLYKNRSKAILSATVVLSLAPLIFYKYALFLCKSFGYILNFELNLELLDGLLLPVGISFFTFQALSYTIDIYRKKICQRTSLIDFCLFVSFFPTILSGPIEKARNLLPQIKTYFCPATENISQGCCIFVWGLFKKMVVADRLANYVDWAYGQSLYVGGGTLAVAAIFYSIQIYCDFSGYSDMALGVAKSLGFDVTKNFRQPYFSRTFKEFWRKWHIALTSWFTEYVYFSLGGSRVKHKLRWIFNISTIFLLSGIWHGAAWSFVIWGGLHAMYYLAEHFLGLQREDYKWNILKSVIAGIIVFLLASVAWIFFRLDFYGAIYVLAKIATDGLGGFSMGSSSFAFAATCLMIVVFILYELMVRKGMLIFDVRGFQDRLSRNIVSIVPLLLLMALFGVSSDNFVYFQF